MSGQAVVVEVKITFNSHTQVRQSIFAERRSLRDVHIYTSTSKISQNDKDLYIHYLIKNQISHDLLSPGISKESLC